MPPFGKRNCCTEIQQSAHFIGFCMADIPCGSLVFCLVFSFVFLCFALSFVMEVVLRKWQLRFFDVTDIGTDYIAGMLKCCHFFRC